jgi:hypothetical protein
MGGKCWGLLVKEGGVGGGIGDLGDCKGGCCGKGLVVWYAKEERTSETQLIKYVPGSTDKECVCGFWEYPYFFRIFGGGATRGLVWFGNRLVGLLSSNKLQAWAIKAHGWRMGDDSGCV